MLVCLTGLVLAGLLLLIVFGGPLGTAIADKAGLGGAFELLWGIFRWPIAFLAIVLFFSLVYYLAPNVDVRSWEWLSPGALVGSVMWLVLSGLFSLAGRRWSALFTRLAKIGRRTNIATGTIDGGRLGPRWSLARVSL